MGQGYNFGGRKGRFEEGLESIIPVGDSSCQSRRWERNIRTNTCLTTQRKDRSILKAFTLSDGIPLCVSRSLSWGTYWTPVNEGTTRSFFNLVVMT